MMYLILDELKKKSAKAEVNTRQNQQYSPCHIVILFLKINHCWFIFI